MLRSFPSGRPERYTNSISINVLSYDIIFILDRGPSRTKSVLLDTFYVILTVAGGKTVIFTFAIRKG